MNTHFVYGLFDLGALVYIGRTLNVLGRWRTFNKRHGIATAYQVLGAYTDFEEAMFTEIFLIGLYRPPFNHYVASSPARLGRNNSDNHNDSIRSALQGRKLTEEHKARLWETRSRELATGANNAFYGKHHKPATVKRLREANRLQFADPIKRERHRVACREAGLRIGRKKAA